MLRIHFISLLYSICIDVMLDLQMAAQIAALREEHVTHPALIRLRLCVLPKVVFQVARAVKHPPAVFVKALEFKVVALRFRVHFFKGSVPAIWNSRKCLLALIWGLIGA
jgi:hypothetical protein